LVFFKLDNGKGKGLSKHHQTSVYKLETDLKKPIIALVVPAYNESGNLKAFFDAVNSTIENLDSYFWEFVFVDDGSSDNTWELIEDLAESDSRVKGISLSRNFGKEIALTAGLELAGDVDALIFIDADLQHPPQVITDLVAQWQSGYQIVSTKRETIQYSMTRKIGARFFYFMLNRFSDLKDQSRGTDFRLLDREALKVLKTFEERTRFFRGLIDWMGFKKTFVTFSAPDRANGESAFKLGTLTQMAVNSFTTFSLLPLRVTGWLGLTVVSLSLAVLFYMIITQFFFSQVFTPLAYFVVFNTLLFGVVLAALGLIALYIGHIHTEVIRRPLYIVQNRIGFEDE
jgi:polyisoprenyl-phosphate glycosyltransferase